MIGYIRLIRIMAVNKLLVFLLAHKRLEVRNYLARDLRNYLRIRKRGTYSELMVALRSVIGVDSAYIHKEGNFYVIIFSVRGIQYTQSDYMQRVAIKRAILKAARIVIREYQL